MKVIAAVGRWWWLLEYCFWSRVYDEQQKKKKKAREYGETLAAWSECREAIPGSIAGRQGALHVRLPNDVRAA